MQFLTFAVGSVHHLGLALDEARVIDLTTAWTGSPAPHDVADLIALGEGGLERVRGLARSAKPVDRKGLRLLAPIPRPKKNVFCVGRNYQDHIAEGDRAQGRPATPPPPAPEFFTKAPTCVIASGDTIPAHVGVTEKLDYEVELALVIGKTGHDIAKDKVFDHIFGYSIINDITGRDLQRLHGQWFKGKSLDRSCPFGPVVVHKSALPNPQALGIRLTVNGEQRQSSNTRQMIFDIPTIIMHLSKGMTLEAGDIIATGTPSGVGYAMDPPRHLKAGDRISAEVEGIGALVNTVV